MTFQILVNHFNEDVSIVERFLTSLAWQQDVKFSVLILSDGGSRIPEANLKGFPFPIVYRYAEHSGVCHSRNLLLDKSTADYIMFCDIDDQFTDPYGLKTLFDTANKFVPDVIGCPYLVERKNQFGLSYMVLDKDVLRVHGKLFRRQYLINNNIRFPDSMEFSGDMMFLWLAFSLTNSVKWIKKNFYLWKFNQNSVTRKNSYHHVRTYNKMLECYTLLAEDLKKRNRLDIYENLIATLFATIYIDLTFADWKTYPEDLRTKAEKYAKETIQTYINDYRNISKECRKSKYQVMINYTNRTEKSGSFEDMLNWLESFMKDQNKAGT